LTMKKIRAFTLVELLIASAIFLVVMVTVYSTFNTGIFGYHNTEDLSNTYQNARQIFERIKLDLRDSFAYFEANSKFTGDKSGVNFLTLVDSFNDGKLERGFAFVSYRLQDNKLMRLCRKNREATNAKSEIKAEEMSDNIAVFFSYCYLDQADNSLKEKETWNDKKKLPAAVKINSLNTCFKEWF